MDKGKQPAEKKKKPVEKEEKPAVKAPVPGANYPTVEKGSRRSKKKNATNDKSTEAGPSVYHISTHTSIYLNSPV